MARCLYTFVQLGAGVGPGNVEGATLPQSEAPRCTVERFRTTMKTSISIVLGCSLVAFAAGPFVTDKTDPAAAGMNPARLRSEEHTSEIQSLRHLVCRLLLEKKK